MFTFWQSGRCGTLLLMTDNKRPWTTDNKGPCYLLTEELEKYITGSVYSRQEMVIWLSFCFQGSREGFLSKLFVL